MGVAQKPVYAAVDLSRRASAVGNVRPPSRRSQGVWQPKFWEHTLQDDEDFERHLNYIHYNPVKHGYVSSPRDWPWSSFHRYVKAGVYDADWGSGTSEILPDLLKMDSTIGE